MKPDRVPSAVATFAMVSVGVILYGVAAALAAPVGGSRPARITNPGVVWPLWSASRNYTAGDLVTCDGCTYKCVQAHSSADGGDPSTTPALWRLIT
ncbi:carbohydrate-binding protein [Streptosporangium sp. NPDC000239]|uniref:Carbohydrate-binding protein n=1 Tax=Streptosporangium jomthongense TaxID=1193683 RepID=A0ABV8FF79_9ACTN